ncbi:FAD:protein FMN transferase [Microbacterium sp.]|uniref:FAD:protein FMN transferase n=1 Tax=Microbacterium sp. TaxID=51671 RepID=UPI003A8BDB56
MPAQRAAARRSALTGTAWRFDAIGTRWIVRAEPMPPETVRAELMAAIERFDREWSRFRADSLVCRLAREAGRVPAPPDAQVMLEAFRQVSDATGEAVNPLVGDSLARRGYDAGLSLSDRGAHPAPSPWQRVLTWDDGELALTRPATIDVGALGKGRLVDIVAGIVAEHTPGRVVVDAGGDIAVRGSAEPIGLEHPFDTSRAIGVWRVADRALCASAVNRRAWGDGLHHVLDARTGEPVRTIAATWVCADTAMRADAVATALFFDGGPRLAHAWGADWVRMTTTGTVEWSPGCDAELFLGR